MPRILVLGGYGVFGRRTAARLACEADLDIIIAGRSAGRAKAAADHLSHETGRSIAHAALDASTVAPEILRGLRVAVVINTSGPFQTQDYTLARAAIGAGAHYIDLADAPAFVTGIGGLDAEARAAGVLVVSGASSVPGLSAAVLDHYAPRFACLDAVSHGISPGNSFDPGEATAASILGAVGQPFQMRIGGRNETVYGWQGLSRHSFPGIGRRWMGHCNVPDLTLFAVRCPSLQTVRFAAGVEVALFHLGIWAMSWLVRLGIVRRPARFASPLLAVKRRLGCLGSDQGGMFMTLEGEGSDGQSQRIDWHLEAGSGHGPYIPAIASVILAKKLARGHMSRRGAMPCVGLLTLDEFMAEVADLDIRAGDTATPLYARVLASAFAMLPGRVHELHDVRGEQRWTGRADVERGGSPLARLLATIAGLPPAGRDVPLTVTFTPARGEEIWTRDFAGIVFRSRQGEHGAMLWEDVGPTRLLFEPVVGPDGLSLEVRGLSVLGLPLPRWLLPAIATREWEEGGRYRFSVEARLPLVGLLVRYSGWLVS